MSAINIHTDDGAVVIINTNRVMYATVTKEGTFVRLNLSSGEALNIHGIKSVLGAWPSSKLHEHINRAIISDVPEIVEIHAQRIGVDPLA